VEYYINKILVPLDFSPESLNALQTAIAISKRQLAAITLIHVIENNYALFPPEAGAVNNVLLPKMLKDSKDSLNKLSKLIRLEHDLVVNNITRSGNPADEICYWAAGKKYDLIVMGTHGASGLKEFLIGSNAYRVVKNSSCPVLTIPGINEWLDFKKILFPIRLVPNALDKYHMIRPIIRKNGSSLKITGMVKKGSHVDFIEINTLINTIKSKMEEDGVACKSEIYNCDDISKKVLAVSDEEQSDMIVITATLDNSIRDFFMGPYTQDIVNHSKVPVLSIRPQLSAKVVNIGKTIESLSTSMYE